MTVRELINRRWRVRIGTGGTDAIEFTDLDFKAEIVKSLRPEPNKCSITIYNLSLANRSAIEQANIYDPKKIKGQKKTGQPKQAANTPKRGNIRVEIEAGYATTGTHLIARMDLRRALSTNDGATVETKIEGEDGGRSILSSRVTQSFPPGSSKLQVVQACAAALGLGQGNIVEVAHKLQGKFPHGTTLNGQAAAELKNLLRRSRITYSVQNGVLRLRDLDAGNTAKAFVLSSGTGLVGAPERDAAGQIVATTLLLPTIAPGAYVQLDSLHVKGTYLVRTVTYSLDSSGQDWYSRLELVPG